jgi:integrase
MAIPTPAQVGQLMSSADDGFDVFVAVCAFAGLRLGEAAGLQVGDIEFLRRQLTVSRQVQRENGHQLDIRPPKYGSERVVHLPDELVTMLSAHVATRVLGTGPSR